jgi:hypothetical protein
MKIARILNPNYSLMVSLFSGVGLLAVVALAPTKEENENQHQHEKAKETNPGFYEEVKNRQEISKNPNYQDRNSSQILRLRITPQELEEYSRSLSLRNNLWSYQGNNPNQILQVSNFRSNLLNLGSNDPNTKFLNWKQDRVYANVALANSDEFNPSVFNWNQKIYRMTDSRPFGANRVKNVELSYAINRSISAVFTTSSRDLFDDRQRDSDAKNYALAGISLSSGDSISTRFVAGDTNFQLNRSQEYSPTMRMSSYANMRDIGISEKDRMSQRTFEWQTNFKPSKSIMIQTAIYNNSYNANVVNNANSTPATNTLDSGRMSVFFGKKNIILNVKYDYKLGQQDLRSVLNQWEPKQDAASLGFILFLDPSQKYSIYLGGNQFNIANQNGIARNNNSSSRSPASFTASIRGKTLDGSKSNFFLNFQNQPPGMMGLGSMNAVVPNGATNSQSFYEYATTLGMEVNF